MVALAEASLSAEERRTLERFVPALLEHFGPEFEALWLFGSRARGEPPHDESDVDLILLLREPSREKHLDAIRLVNEAQELEGARRTYFSVKLQDREWVEDRRAIDSFFMREVDRDKIVLHGDP